ncbi:hypothetical protein ACE41H_22410 [Paenibacillus enshidis]|uniref:Uncharacterized protein n=1 Tax=Paenibacillus enshidis TaxID=1458439 RepID=A0ABV5AZT7_9BACL
MTVVANKTNNLVEFKGKGRKNASGKAIADYLGKIKPFHLQSEEYQKSSRDAIREEEEEWD